MSKIFKRSYVNVLRKRLIDEQRKFIQVLYGPRQVGKTTIAKQFLEDTDLMFLYKSADAVSFDSTNWIGQQWNALRLRMKQESSKTAILVLDEIQKIPDWSDYVKKEWDSDSNSARDIRLLILGSSRLLIQQGLTESLAGRYETLYATHWSYSEMKEAFGISHEDYVFFGAYPGSVSLIGDEERWLNYINDSMIESSISRDILSLTRVNKPALMRRLFEIGCQYSGQILSYTKILGQLHDAGNTTTLSHYLQLLDTAGLLGALEKYSPNVIRKRSSSPKFQVHNNALLTATSRLTLDRIRTDGSLWGRWVESAIGSYLYNWSLSSPLKVYYWREGNSEVDFIIENKGKVVAIEVKSSVSKRTSGLSDFKTKFDCHKAYLVGDEGFTWKELLTIDPHELF